MNPIGNCEHCKKELKKLTKTRDWNTRKYHLKCYNKIQKSIELNHFIELMNKKHGTDVKLIY